MSQEEVLKYLFEYKKQNGNIYLSTEDIATDLKKKKNNVSKALKQLSKYKFVDKIISNYIVPKKINREMRLYKINKTSYEKLSNN